MTKRIRLCLLLATIYFSGEIIWLRRPIDGLKELTALSQSETVAITPIPPLSPAEGGNAFHIFIAPGSTIDLLYCPHLLDYLQPFPRHTFSASASGRHLRIEVYCRLVRESSVQLAGFITDSYHIDDGGRDEVSVPGVTTRIGGDDLRLETTKLEAPIVLTSKASATLLLVEIIEGKDSIPLKPAVELRVTSH